MTTVSAIRNLAQEFRDPMFKAAEWIWAHPQLGFKEWEASDYLKGKFSEMGFRLVEAGNIPGFYFDIDTGREGPTFAILGELDAITVPSHPACDKETGAVHACGHHCQAASLIGVAGVLRHPSVLSELCGRIRIVAVPAEELVDLDNRAAMRDAGTIRHLSGKTEFMARGFFDGVDIAAMIHTAGGDKPGLHVGPGMTGIIAKRVTFFGTDTNSAEPADCVNALYAAQTALGAINALRESFNDRYRVRCQAIISEGGRSVVNTPDRVVVESHVRATDFDVLRDVNAKVNRAYTAAAAAFGARVRIEDLDTYVPENDRDNPEFMKLAHDIASELFGEENVRLNFDERGRSPGGTDMGNLGAVIPVIQPYSTGQTGGSHRPEFAINSLELAVFDPATVLASLACALLRDGGEKAREIIAAYKPRFSSIGEFLAALDDISRPKKGIEYDGETAVLNW